MAVALGIPTAHSMGESVTRPCAPPRSALAALILRRRTPAAGARLASTPLNRSTAPCLSPYPVIPAKAGIQPFRFPDGFMDSCLRGNDG
jgi:hypothetical protein